MRILIDENGKWYPIPEEEKNCVLTFDEVMDADIFFYESENNGSEYGRASRSDGEWISITRLGYNGWAYEKESNYGETWRCWKYRPTKVK